MFLPLTIVEYDGRVVLAVKCACGQPIDRGSIVEFDNGTVMLCHEDCLAKL